ncbi:MAG: FHA domain-containing protein, partial [Planctomycetaceae bacterium]|nr:FHA domain-containing protein [Planctomycetaceae bacterium]
MTSFYVIQGNDQGRRFELLETVSTIGRAFHNHVRLHDAEVSRCHALVLGVEDHFRLIDNESTNGVFVNGKREKNCILNNGDQILLGQTLLVFNQIIQKTPDDSGWGEDDSQQETLQETQYSVRQEKTDKTVSSSGVGDDGSDGSGSDGSGDDGSGDDGLLNHFST